MKKLLNYLFNTRDGLILLGGAAALAGGATGWALASKNNEKVRKAYQNAVVYGMKLRDEGVEPEQVNTIIVYGKWGKPALKTVVDRRPLPKTIVEDKPSDMEVPE